MFKVNFVYPKYKMLWGELKLTSKTASMKVMFCFTFSSNDLLQLSFQVYIEFICFNIPSYLLGCMPMIISDCTIKNGGPVIFFRTLKAIFSANFNSSANYIYIAY